MTFLANNIDACLNLPDIKLPQSGSSSISQKQINSFADLTGDHQWIHTDVERARLELPQGSTIAHGLLVLSLASIAAAEIIDFSRCKQCINYGYDRVRFIKPVLVNQNLVLTMKCEKITRLDDFLARLYFKIELQLEKDGATALVADSIIQVSY
jgi:acyl dehydratase